MAGPPDRISIGHEGPGSVVFLLHFHTLSQSPSRNPKSSNSSPDQDVRHLHYSKCHWFTCCFSHHGDHLTVLHGHSFLQASVDFGVPSSSN